MRNPRIDFLRGVAIFAVLLLHFSLTYNLIDSPLSRLLAPSVVRAAVVNGNYGVTLFFVISGYLISSNNVLRYGSLATVQLRHFYALRFSRIIPPLLLALAIIVPLGLAGVPSFADSAGGHRLSDAFFVMAVISILTLWHNVLMQAVGYFNYCLNIYWSLSVEEVFYLAFPIACLVLKRNWLIVALCAIAIAAGPLYRSAHREDELYFMYGYLACFDAIAFGCLVALLEQTVRLHPAAVRSIRLVAGAALAVVYFLGIDGHEVYGFTWIALCAAALLVEASTDSREPPRWLPTRLVCWFGRHSYELYLFHIIVLAAMRDLLPRGTLPSAWKLPLFALFLGISAIVAGVVARCYAEPINQALRHRLPRSAGDPAARMRLLSSRR
jgi:peptidoglycan/LPS O-acetylase OafA/YrhL